MPRKNSSSEKAATGTTRMPAITVTITAESLPAPRFLATSSWSGEKTALSTIASTA